MCQGRSATEPAKALLPAGLASVQAAAEWFDFRNWLTVAAMLGAVMAVYVPVPSGPGARTLEGMDYFQMHVHRIRFAQEALFGPHPHLPSWYTREVLGTPFWSNAQDFPFLPTRLPLLAYDPYDAFAVAVKLAAALSALFTYLYARRIGLSRLPSAAAGWTFACSGFFASRVMAGHLPLLEAYPSLPLLLWLVERRHAAPSPSRGRSFGLLALGLACGCIALAGHPQLPIYAIIAASIYALYRCGLGSGTRAVAAMGAGVLCASFVLWPMWRVVGRSTRLLALDQPSNDISFPYRRLLAFVLPWAQGWSGPVRRTPHLALSFPNPAYFWDTVCYVGWLPLLAALFLLIRALVRRRAPARPWLFIAGSAIAALLLAFPAAQALLSHLPVMLLRSPARLIYITTFGLAMGLAAALEVFQAWATESGQVWVLGLLALALAAHLLDLGSHDRQFILAVPYNTAPTEAESQLVQRVGDGRVAIDGGLKTPLNRQLDDIGFFDSITLAKPYAALLDLSNRSPRLNTEHLDGSDLNARALAACGVSFEMTTKREPGSPPSKGSSPIRVLTIADPAPRAAFYPRDRIIYLDAVATHQHLRDPTFDLRQWLMLPPKTGDDDATIRLASTTSPVGSTTRPTQVSYKRVSDDRITIDGNYDQGGYLRCLEAWDPGWSATVDGAPAPVLLADDVFIAVALPPGTHTVCLTFSTPGATTGALLSIAGLLSLITIAFLPDGRRAGPLN